MPKFLRIALVLLPSLAFLVVATSYLSRKWNDTPTTALGAGGRGRLVVVVVFDQMRGDYPQRWANLMGPDGFNRVARDGFRFTNAHWPYSCTATGPGHASIGTGTTPNRHGIIDNEWFDRVGGGKLYCTASARPYARVPESSRVTALSFSPTQLRGDGIGDRLKDVQKRSRVFSLALKDRAAVMMAGQHPDAAYCFDAAEGEFHTSSYYRDTIHNWALHFNRANKADAWFDSKWERLLPVDQYNATVGPDDAPGESRFEKNTKTGAKVGYGPTFPHEMNIDGQEHPNKRYYERLECSPFGNQLLWQFAQACIDGEQLGSKGTTDLLFLGFSSNDLIGHKWGPDSHEVLDVTLRSDALLAEMLKHLDEKLGPGNTTLFVTADHGICPLPEHEFARNPDAERFDPRSELDPAVMGKLLDSQFGKLGESPMAWFAEQGKSYFPNVYLNGTAIEKHGVKTDDVADALAKWIENRPHILMALPRSVLMGKPSEEAIVRACQLGYDPARSGDVVCVMTPYCLSNGIAATGTSHGTPHDYDTHVPLMGCGAGVPKWGDRAGRANAMALAPMLCSVLGLPIPDAITEPLPDGWK